MLASSPDTLGPVPETQDFTYRKILSVDLDRDRCTVLKSDLDGWQPGHGPITGQLAQFALGGALHPEDAERFVTFTRLDNLRRIATAGQAAPSLLYRRRAGAAYRWNLLEVIPDHRGNPRFVTLCVKDVDDPLRESAQREGLAAQSQDVLRSLEDRAYIISSLSSLFFSTYYVDLEKDTYRAVTQLGRVGDVLGGEVNFTAALGIYASHFVHPDDRDMYLQVMSVGNLVESLRWWQPIVACEYRKLPEGPGDCSWVRASAVLARTGEDDLPKTAVYVAQDITTGRRA